MTPAQQTEITPELVKATNDLTERLKDIAISTDATDARIRAALAVAILEGVPVTVVLSISVAVGLNQNHRMDDDVTHLVA